MDKLGLPRVVALRGLRSTIIDKNPRKNAKIIPMEEIKKYLPVTQYNCQKSGFMGEFSACIIPV
jgi:hypothetical protein